MLNIFGFLAVGSAVDQPKNKRAHFHASWLQLGLLFSFIIDPRRAPSRCDPLYLGTVLVRALPLLIVHVFPEFSYLLQ